MENEGTNGLETLLSYVGVDLLKLEAGQYESTGVYVEKLRARYCTTQIYGGMRDAGRLVEPKDRLHGADADFPKAKAFETGSLIALRVMQEFLSPELKRKMFHVNVISEDPRNQGNDFDHGLHLAAEDIVDCGQRGYVMAKDYHELLEEWEDVLCPNVVDQPFFRRGFGFVIYLMQEASNLQQMEELEKQLRDGVNWDSVAAGWIAESKGDTGVE